MSDTEISTQALIDELATIVGNLTVENLSLKLALEKSREVSADLRSILADMTPAPEAEPPSLQPPLFDIDA